MANPLERAASRRKVIYLGAIVGLFTVSLFWRGKLDVPFGNPARAEAAAPTAVNRMADRLSRASVGQRADRLELRELDQGEPEIFGTAIRLALTGSRGAAVTFLWWTAIEKQKRNEWHEFETAARLVTRLQPNFVTPWIFQGWNIAYNVSVENDKLGDMFFYIARGIELLTEGDRLNTKVYVSDGKPYKIGSPDIRYQIGFYYQNKFTVSDKVNTLRCIMQLAAMRPGERDPKALTRNGRVDPEAFRAFCLKNPQLVRRLREHVFVDTDQRNPYANPELIVQFLDDNSKVPTRYTPDGDLKKGDTGEQFPAFPPKYEGPEEYNPESVTDDTFDALNAARAWFGYAITTIPPQKTGPDGRPLPWASPVAGEYDQFKYRMPRSPAYILFRQQHPRSQTYLAERLAKEGWFDAASSWDPDERTSTPWFRKSAADPGLVLTTPAQSREEWRRAFQMWQQHAAANALILDTAARLNLQQLAAPVPGEPRQLPLPGDFPPEKLAAYGITQENVDAKKALIYYDQNRQMTNFPYFMATSEAEQDPLTVEARKLLFRAEANERYASPSAAIRDYVAGLAAWRQALVKYPQFHRAENSEKTEEDTYEYELALTKLLAGEGSVDAAAGNVVTALTALVPAVAAPAPGEAARRDAAQDVAEVEALRRVVALDPRVQEAVRAEARKYADRVLPAAHHAALALAGPRAADAPGMLEGLRSGIEQSAARGDFASRVAAEKFDWLREYMREPFKTNDGRYLPVESDYWVRPMARTLVRNRLGLVRETPAASTPPTEAPAPAGP